MKRKDRINTRTDKLIRAAMDKTDVAENGTSTFDVAVELDVDKIAEKQTASERGRKNAGMRRGIDRMKLIRDARLLLDSGENPRKLTSILHQRPSYSGITKEHLRRLLQEEGFVPKRHTN